MYPPIWGQYFHDVLFFVALSYPHDPTNEKKICTRQFVERLFANLPCPGCQVHAVKLIKNNPPVLNSRQSFIEWCVQYHNAINQRTDKRDDWTVEDAIEAFRKRHFIKEQVTATITAEQKRQEDHTHIQMLRAENNTYRQKLGIPDEDSFNSEDTMFKQTHRSDHKIIILIIISSITFGLALIAVVQNSIYRRKYVERQRE